MIKADSKSNRKPIYILDDYFSCRPCSGILVGEGYINVKSYEYNNVLLDILVGEQVDGQSLRLVIQGHNRYGGIRLTDVKDVMAIANFAIGHDFFSLNGGAIVLTADLNRDEIFPNTISVCIDSMCDLFLKHMTYADSIVAGRSALDIAEVIMK